MKRKPTQGRYQKRHHAREHALQMLYAQSVTEYSVNMTSSLFWTMKDAEEDPEFAEEIVPDEVMKKFSLLLVQNTVAHQQAIDERIAGATEHWDISRLARVDKVILRMAISEMLCMSNEIPLKVTINEAIELAKEYSTEDSGRFVNGILDRISREIQIENNQTSIQE